MRFSRGVVVVVCLLVAAGLVYAGHMSGDDAMAKLMDGNKRFTGGAPVQKDCSAERRGELTKGQHPYATVLSCSDSRVPPELVFDQALGEIFIIRVAGNVVEPTTLGSIEYGAEHLHTPLLVILGHEKCGAVTAALEAKGKPEGNIGAILKKIMPAVEKAKAAKAADKASTLEIAIQENIRNSYQEIMKNSPIVSHLVKEGKLKVVGAEYYLGSGEVKVVDLAAAKASHHGH